ncbi:MAG: 50S ribosomal protein L4 [Patescibacteria group bacterium]
MAKTAINIPLVKQALLARQASKRQGTSHVKTRSEVSGGGRKPWRQKGTGRARAGSNRSPLWVGGGITFGPRKERNYKVALPKKMSRQALLQLINHLNDQNRVIVVKSLALTEAKTKAALKLLGSHNLIGKKTILVTEKIEPELVMAARNLKGIKTVVASNLSILDLSAGVIVAEEAAAKTWGIVKAAPSAKLVAAKAVKPQKA